MSKALYIATGESNSGKSILVLGLMRVLLGKTPRVGYFRPVIDDYMGDDKDNHIQTVVSYFDLQLDYEDAYAFTRSELVKLQSEGREEYFIDRVIAKYKKLEERFDFILVEGTDFSDHHNVSEFEGNVTIAKNLGIPAIILATGLGKSMEGLISTLKYAYNTYKSREVEVLGVVANMVMEENRQRVLDELSASFSSSVEVIAIPKIESLSHPTVKEIAIQLEANVLFGEDAIDNQVGSFGVGAMQLRNYLTLIGENSLVITPGDRADIILGVLQANTSSNYPKIAGMVLTGGLIPEEPILKLIEGVPDVIPILSVKEGTFDIANKIGAIKPKIYAQNKLKITSSLSTFDKYVDIESLSNRLVSFKHEGMTPRMFQYNLLQRARQHKKHIVLPEGNDERILTAAARLVDLDVVDISIIGNENEVHNLAVKKNIPLNFDKVNIIDPIKSPNYEDYVSTFYELRKHKNVALDTARDLMLDVSYFGTMMVYKGRADGMVSGAMHTTQHTIRPALQFIKTKPGASVVSSIFFMCLEDRVSVFGDCAINPNPNAEELAEIAIASADSTSAFGIEPKIAMLSYSSGSSGKGADVDVVREATMIVKSKRPELKIEGPIQYDAAVDPGVGKSKMPNSEVAGQASVLIFPDLNTGNNTYKAVQRETGALAIGPMLQGLNKPVNDLSRGCTVNDILNTVVITAIQAQGL